MEAEDAISVVVLRLIGWGGFFTFCTWHYMALRDITWHHMALRGNKCQVRRVTWHDLADLVVHPA